MFHHQETRLLLVTVGFALLAMAVLINPSLLEFSDDGNIGGYAMLQPKSFDQVPLDRTVEPILGDIDRDGMITPRDLTIMDRKPFQKQDPRYADLNADGVVDHTDLFLLQQYLNNRIQELPFIRGDVNQDGAFTVRDVELIAAYTDGQSTFSNAQFTRADIDFDGVVNKSDVELAINMLK